MTRFGEILKTLGNCLRVYLLFAKTLNHIWTFFNAIGRILTVKKGKNLKNNSAIWSHCSQPKTDPKSWWFDDSLAKALTSSSGPRKQRYSSSILVNSCANTDAFISSCKMSTMASRDDDDVRGGGNDVDGENCDSFSTWKKLNIHLLFTSVRFLNCLSDRLQHCPCLKTLSCRAW